MIRGATTVINHISPFVRDHRGHEEGRLPPATCVTNIYDLPLEIKREIASHLNSKDYAHLRETCKTMSQSLESFSAINTLLNNGEVRGKTKRNLCRIACDRIIRIILANKSPKEVAHNLRHCFISNIRDVKHNLIVGITYHRCLCSKSVPCNLSNSLRLLYDLISANTKGHPIRIENWVVPNKYVAEFRIVIDNLMINFQSLSVIFSSFNQVFTEINGIEKLIVAALTNKLKEHLCHYPPEQITRNEIMKCCAQYPLLFYMGENALEKIVGYEE
ncbi:hypothetical protein Sant_P0251 (plasmid) [Sodalis praecaptivus]|uniref:F-box domain-containing protein n=1 Tax=Sodalis praecaptivus TaxID=1239307 RepID=W0I4A1_9GAMM|nr:hypothetical protein Sant_P0251 [Sodalis praecaptivus]